MFRTSFVMLLTCQALVSIGVSCAQETGYATPIGPAHSELPYFLGQYDATKAAGSRLQTLMDELQKQYAADPNADLRVQVREREEFTAKLENLRSDAQSLVNPALLPSFDPLISDAQETMNNLKADLNARVLALNRDRIAVKGQIDKLQKEIDLNNKLAKTLAETIQSKQDDRRREGIGPELDALIRTLGVGHSQVDPLPDPKKENHK